MIKVIIVDDEPKLREGLKSIIPWEQLGYQIVGTAANGNEAILKYNSLNPDLMIIDIRMPGMDGLELIKRIRTLDNSVHVLILSGYADFEYAKKAISLRIDGYLLKPIDEEELISYLDQLRVTIQTEQEINQRDQSMNGLNSEHLIQSILTDGRIGVYDQAAKLNLVWKTYQVLLISLHSGEDGLEETKLLLRRKLSDLFIHRQSGIVFFIQSKIGMLLKEPLLNEQIRKEWMKEIQSIIAELGMECSVAIGEHVTKLDDIVNSYTTARQLIKHQFFYEPGRILCIDSERAYKASLQPKQVDYSLFLQTVSEQLLYAIDVGNQEAVASLIHSVGNHMIQMGYSEQNVKNGYVQLMTGVLGKFMNHTSQQLHTEIYIDRLTAIYELKNIGALYKHLISLLNELIVQQSMIGSGHEVKKMIDLMSRKYNETLKLETLAEVFNYNSAYLGKMFKNETGEYFNTYLDKLRIEKAKQFLEQGLKVYEVAEKVGYTNVDYFHTKFRKYVGTSPSAYRKKIEDL